MNKLNFLYRINPSFLGFKTQEITSEGKKIGYHCFGVEKPAFTFSGGTSSKLENATRIAVAEAFERSLLSKIASNPSYREDFFMGDNPSSSGFAAGFEQEKTSYRALCEGLECWAWSKWVDSGFIVPSTEKPKILSELSKHFLKYFKENYWFSKKINITYKGKEITLNFVVFLGCTDMGIFSGSRVSSINDDLWEHPVIEAYRNFKNSELYEKNKFELTDIIQERVIFFSKNKKIALNQVLNASESNWPKPEVLLLKEFNTGHPELFLYRCLMKDFIGWHEGDVTRFVY